MNFLEKLDFLMNKYGLNKRTLSQKSDIPYTTIDNWYKRGYEGLKLTTLRKLNDFFNTALDYWILDEITDPNYGKSSGFEVEYEEMEHIKKYRFISEHLPGGTETVDYILDHEYKEAKELEQRLEELREKAERITSLEASVEKLSSKTRLYIYMHKIAAAGTGFYFDDIPTETIAAPYMEGADFIIGVSGDSMEPTYRDGDLVYVEKRQIVETGDIGVFMVDNECYIKEAGGEGLISHNEKYPMIPGSDRIICVGKVLGKVELN